jgi:REP element-mobilizing transposase RayT
MPHTPSPLAYLITFTCYGTRLHGDEEASADQRHNIPGSPFLPPRRGWVIAEERKMAQPPYQMDRARREIVLRATQQHCAQRNWRLLAVHVRSTHVHLVLGAEQGPERILTEIKAYASRALSRAGFDGRARKRWARHGSTRYLWRPQHVKAAVEYVVFGQGDPMAVWRSQG